MDYQNVREPWEIHDTLCVCTSLYGSEAQAGFFSSFVGFGQQSEHLFFKRRSEGNVHRAYNNQQSEDRMDFVFHAFSIGLMFYAPPIPWDYQGAETPETPNDAMTSFWTGDLPRHCSASLKIGQDAKLDLQAMMMSPGYGPQTSGAALGIDGISAVAEFKPEFVWQGGQGSPIPAARYWLPVGGRDAPQPIAIPKGELIELRLELSEYARNVLTNVGGPGFYAIGQTPAEGVGIVMAPVRYGIQASLWGYRDVQQRGELRAS